MEKRKRGEETRREKRDGEEEIERENIVVKQPIQLLVYLF